MTFIVILIVLAIERFFDWSHVRRFTWFTTYQQWLISKLPGQSAYLILALAIVPLLIVVMLINGLLIGLFYGVGHLLFSLFILLYCLGPKNLWVESFASISSITQMTPNEGNEVRQFFDKTTETSDSQLLHKQLISYIFIEANTRLFAPICWYAILGPMGVLLYRLLALWSINPAQDLQAQQEARFIKNLLDFFPIRLLAFFFALGGHFIKVFPYWSKQALRGWSVNEILLGEAGLIALIGDDQIKIAEDGTAEKNAISLLDRSFVIFLVLVLVLQLLI